MTTRKTATKKTTTRKTAAAPAGKTPAAPARRKATAAAKPAAAKAAPPRRRTASVKVAPAAPKAAPAAAGPRGLKLVIVESPAKARTIAKYLGPGYIVKASNGHVRDLPKSKLGVDVEKRFEPSYVLIRKKGDIVRDLKAAAKRAATVYLAPDPDREGEAIAWHLAETLGESE